MSVVLVLDQLYGVIDQLYVVLILEQLVLDQEGRTLAAQVAGASIAMPAAVW